MDFTAELNGCTLEYYDDEHMYLVDGVIVPSITQLLKIKFNGKYNGVSKATLQRASDKGTAVHDAIERYCKDGIEADLPEVRNFKFLKKQYGFEVVRNEVPVILKKNGKPISAGRLDLWLYDPKTDTHGIGDIKRTATLDKNYLAYQLNLYRIALMQCYNVDIDFLKGLHLREDIRKYVNIPINEDIAEDLIMEYCNENQT